MNNLNPFKSQNIIETDEMKGLFKELQELTTRICLQYVEDCGTTVSIDSIHRNIQSSIDYAITVFKIRANSALINQPNTNLPLEECIAIAAHTAYNEIVENGKA